MTCVELASRVRSKLGAKCDDEVVYMDTGGGLPSDAKIGEINQLAKVIDVRPDGIYIHLSHEKKYLVTAKMQEMDVVNAGLLLDKMYVAAVDVLNDSAEKVVK